jgi:hypothetical protein
MVGRITYRRRGSTITVESAAAGEPVFFSVIAICSLRNQEDARRSGLHDVMM